MARIRLQAQPSGNTILVVDDNQTILDTLSRMLTQEGHVVLTAAGGQQAIQLCRTQSVHLMLLDYFMPDLTGEEVVRAVRAFNTDVQIVLQTGYASEKPARQMLRELDIQGYHDKSEGPEKLLIWVDAALKVYRARADLARAMRLKDDFLATMSHELRTPLNAILGLSEALQEQVYGPLNAQQLKSVRGVEEGGRHLLALINDILDLAKIGAGKMDLQCTAIPVQTICQASLRFIKPQAENKEITLSATIDAAVTAVYADERRLMQILVNLLSNAVKFTPRGGTVGIDVTGDREHEVVRLEVWDTGIGIAEEDHSHLFQPFTQLDSGLARQHEGTGLGLALVARMVELHGGSIAVESTVGQGSRFTISLPWPVPAGGSGADTHAPATQAPAPETPALQQEPDGADSSTAARVLLAEDNEANITVIYDYLQAKGYEVIVARNGIEAVARAREITPDLILMDIQMPDMDGIEAIQRIRSDGALVDLPIIALTALAMPGDRERCLAAGADDYVSKPIRLNTLISMLEAYGVGSHQPVRV